MWEQIKTLWGLMGGQRLRYGAAIGAIVLATLCGYLVPLVGRATIDGAIAQARPEAPAAPVSLDIAPLLGEPASLRQNLWRAALAMVLLTALAGGFNYLKGRWAAQACEAIARRLRHRMYDHLHRLPCSYLDKADTGDLVQRCTSDIESTRAFMAVQVVEVGNAAILALTVLPIMLLLSPALTLATLSLMVPIAVFGGVFFAKARRHFKLVEEAEGRMTTVLQENLTGIRVVRAFARQEHEKAKFAEPNRLLRDRNFTVTRLMAWYWSSSDLMVLTQWGLTLAVGGYMVARGQTSVGTLYAFIAYLHMLLGPIRQMGRILTDLGKAMVAMGRLQQVLQTPPEAPVTHPPVPGPGATGGPPLPPPACAGEIVIDRLTFAYAGDGQAGPVLREVSLRIQAGWMVAFLGPSGAGKSTLMHLLLRLYDYTQGTIHLDGRELRTLERQWVRAQVGVVMQEPFLFSRSLKENIRFGRCDADERGIQSAAENAAIHETIAGLEKGYETVIGERGVNLSGGQRQRVAIARALVRDPAVLVLDDALSAVDGKTELMILSALAQRRGRRTTLVIAHRLSTLMAADLIVVLDQGRIIQQGTHAALCAQEGLYRRLWNIQSATEVEDQSPMADSEAGRL